MKQCSALLYLSQEPQNNLSFTQKNHPSPWPPAGRGKSPKNLCLVPLQAAQQGPSGVGGTSKGQLVQPLWSYHLHGWRLHCLLWATLCQCLVTFTLKKCFLMFRRTSWVSVCAHHLTSWYWTPLRRTWLHLHTLPSGIYSH